MWYHRTILAAIEDAINALKSKGVSDQIIQFVESLPDNQKGKAIGALIKILLCKSMILNHYFNLDINLQIKNYISLKDYDPRFRSWALYQYKQLRSNKFIDDLGDERWEYKQPLTGYSGI